MSAARLRQPAQVQDLPQTLADEFKAVHGRPLAPGETYADAVAKLSQSALCLSGGGIRSAAFSLGVVQALARAGLLAKFDYLSTVSGGGFIGAWLSALIRERGSVAAAQAEVAAEGAPAVERLRDYTNYLSPSGGPLSEDSWTGVLLYLRNVIINWLGFGPVFLLAVLVAICYRTLIWTIATAPTRIPALAIVACAIVALVYATAKVCEDLPGHRKAQPGVPPGRDYRSPHAIRMGIVVPLMAWTVGLPATLARWLSPDADPGVFSHAWLPLLYALAITAGYWIGALRERAWQLYWNNFLAWLAATLASALLLFAAMQLIRLAPGNLVPVHEQAEFLAVAGPLLLTLVNMLQATAYVALRREAVLADLDREWLARLSAAKLRVAAIWACFTLCCLTLPRLAFAHPGGHGGDWPLWLVPITTLISGPAAAWIGKQTVSRFETAIATTAGTVKLARGLLPLLGVVFAAGLLSLLSLIASQGLAVLQRPLPHVPALLLLVHVAVAVVLGLIIRLSMRQINVNRFSMHGVYRNRLTRAFLGAARPDRRPDPFTGFDPLDNPRLASLVGGGGVRKLFPVINVTLNLTASTRAAWAERKAAAFTLTPLACGSAALSRGTLSGCYVPTRLYGGQEQESGPGEEPRGITLASAMTISGAAVSPNWGYHSSPVTAFLMTLFNLRLGAWLPNPAVVTDAAEMAQAKPRDAFKPMLADLFASTSECSRAVYLSDGGHFDNLGLYEMLRRRCRLILLVDAGEDFTCQFADFGTAIRRARIDLGVDVTFGAPMRLAARGATTADSLDFAVASIDYRDGGAPGRILYIKPSFLDDIPADVRAYGAAHSYFPHQTTLEQFFTESQFESYRHLGEHQMAKLCRALPAGATALTALFEAAEMMQAGRVVELKREAA
jgi:hypothetical protein